MPRNHNHNPNRIGYLLDSVPIWWRLLSPKRFKISINTIAWVFIKILDSRFSNQSQWTIHYLLYKTITHIFSLHLKEAHLAYTSLSMHKHVHGEPISLMPRHRLFVKDGSRCITYHTILSQNYTSGLILLHRYAHRPIQIQPHPPVNNILPLPKIIGNFGWVSPLPVNVSKFSFNN